MPARKKEYDAVFTIAPWITNLGNPCLEQMVAEAFLARNSAVKARGDDKIIAAGDATIERIQFGKYTGDVACQKAATALRRYDEAYMGTQRKYGRALRRRYGKRKPKREA
jgi:hypothetical protein